MQHNNNNNAIANELNSIIVSLADIKTESISESLDIIESKISHLEHLSQEKSIPELRALTHWMMLNIELDNDNEAQISSLINDGSYYNWMNILSMLLQEYDQTLLPVIYKTLTEPNWVVKPSAPLLRNLASWIEKARLASLTPENTHTDDEQSVLESENIATDSIETFETESESYIQNDDHKSIEDSTEITNNTEEYESDLKSSIAVDNSEKHIFEEVESTVLEKDYSDTTAYEHFSENTTPENITNIDTEKAVNYYDELTEEVTVSPTEELFSKDLEMSSLDVNSIHVEEVEEATVDTVQAKSEIIEEIEDSSSTAPVSTADSKMTINTSLLDYDADDFSMEVDDIIMSLATISAKSNNLSENTEAYTSELQRFDMLAEISGYEKIVPISNWCQQNISLFSESSSDNIQQFVETGECWTWIELVKLAIADPDEISTISELNIELSRDEWLVPLAVDELQSLLLFLRDPQANNTNSSEEIILNAIDSDDLENTTEPKINDQEKPEDNSDEDSSEFSLKWDDDVHPELLEVYFEETQENITDISAYLKTIGEIETTKEQRQDARRTAHTIKGGSAVVGITALSTYAYQLEKILDYAIDHSLPSEANELLHSASTNIEELYEAVLAKKNSPQGFSKTLGKLTLCAEALEELDDEPLELSAPVLPDFITQQNAKNNSTSNENTKEKELELDNGSTESLNLSKTDSNDSVIEDFEVEVSHEDPVIIDDLLGCDSSKESTVDSQKIEGFIESDHSLPAEESLLNEGISADENINTLVALDKVEEVEENTSENEVDVLAELENHISEEPTTENIISNENTTEAIDSKEDIVSNTTRPEFLISNIEEPEDLTLPENKISTTQEVDGVNTGIISDQNETSNEEKLEESETDNNDTSLPMLAQSDDVNDFTAELDDIVMTLITTDVNLEQKPFEIDAYIAELQRLDMLAEISGYPEIVYISNWYQSNLQLIAQEASDELGEFISSGESFAWIELVSASLADPTDISHLSALSTELTRPDWINSLDIGALQNLLLVLRNSEDTDKVEEFSQAIPTESNDLIPSEPEASTVTDEVYGEKVIIPEAKIITWDDDVHPELLSVYLQETSEQITKIAELLQLISKGEADKEQQEHAARIAHTIKGASGVVGITEIVDFTHNLEDILDYAVNNEIPGDTAELLAESSDCLESLFEAVQDKTVAPEEFEPLLFKLITYAESIKNDTFESNESPVELEMPDLPDFITNSIANSQESNSDKVETIDLEDSDLENKKIENNNVDDTVESVDSPIVDEIVADLSNGNTITEINTNEINSHELIDNIENSVKNTTLEDTQPKIYSQENSKVITDSIEEYSEKETVEKSIKEVTQEIAGIPAEPSKKAVEVAPHKAPKAKTAPVTESHIRIPTTLINKLLNLAGELVTTSSQVSDKVERTIETSTQIKAQDKRVHHMLDELSSTIYKQEKDQITMLSSMQNKDFDTLEMDTYNELHSVAGLLTESILDSETIDNTLKSQLHEIHDNLRLLDNLNKELSETILSSRMESLNTLIPRLERIVRQTCRKTGKQADLIVTGNDINIDTEILSGLVDPLLHLLRNAIDHGIEAPEARESKNKKQAGQIQLNFSRQGNFIHMQLKDDGAGIDSEKIYQHAINKGLITPEQEFSKSEVLKLILEPGFSTQTSVTDISGRGVGMDVVNKGIEALKGSLTISSELGQGSSFNIKIPLTLVTSSTLLVETAGNKVAIPTDTIEQLYYLAPEDVLDRDENKFIRHDGKEVAIESLAGILGWTARDVDFTKAQTLLLVKANQKLHAVYIDNIIHSREIVIKSLAHFIDGTKGVIGACHLSDGEVAPVMNLPHLLSLNEQKSYTIKHQDEADIVVSKANHTPQILVVDDSLSNRKALSLIIDKTEYDVVTAVDGLDALNVMNERHIDLVFTDLEMPRMTGLELTQAIRAWDEKKQIPIIMVTSRSTNKHRELAKRAGVDDYLTKPVGTDTLLESIETWLHQTVEA